jgi:flagella basal body P-ring formation protein FlgA
MKALRLFILLVLASTHAMAYQDPQPIKKAVEDYLRVQTKGLPGIASYMAGTIDSNNQLPACSAFQVRQDSGRLWGRSTVTVQCTAGANWSVFVPVQVRIQGNYLVLRRNLAVGQVLMESDIEVRQGDLTEFPGNLLDNPLQAIGKTLGVSLMAGQPLRSDALRMPQVVQQGQRVTIVSGGNGFSVSSEGQALNNASDEQVVKVRLPSGQVVSGIAKSGGTVEITH